MKKAYFAGGCFWCITPMFKIYGAEDVVCGYAGGDKENPTYEEVKSQTTGHRETIAVTYDPQVVDYDTLLDIYLANVDPFDAEGQFIDKGFSYTLAIFWQDEAEREAAEATVAKLGEEAGRPAEIAVLPFKNFYPAEEAHQDYYLKNPEAFEKEMRESGRRREED